MTTTKLARSTAKDSSFHHTVLRNGLHLVGESNPQARSTALGFFVRTGSRDETPRVSGVTHFLEHMIFKGTKRRTALDVNKDFDAIGAHYNAYTSEENTVFHAAILPEYLPQAVDILSDILRPSLREKDFHMEKNVILEEIGMYDDQPMWSAYDAAKQSFFARHPLGNSVLGTAKSIQALQRDEMYEYFQRRYVPNNITFAIAGQFDWKEVVKLVEKGCGRWKKGNAPREVPAAASAASFVVIFKDKVVQEHMFLLSAGPDVKSKDRFAAEVIANAVGDDSGSRLYWALVDPGLADTADTSFHEYEGAGVYYTYIGGDAQRARKNLDIALKVFCDVQRDGLTEDEIQQAKSKLGSRIVRGGERPMGRLMSLGNAWVYLGEYRTVDDDLRAIDAVTPQAVREVLDRYPLDRVTIAALGPIDAVQWATGRV